MSNVVDVTLSCDTSALSAGEVIADSQEIGGAFRKPFAVQELQSLVLIDEDDQGTAVDLIFMRALGVVGAENAVPSISDANSREIIGRFSIAAGDFTDLGGAREATKLNIGLMMKAGATASLWVAAITRSGTPTYTAAGLKLRLGFKDA
jgi:hypothetical protein